VAISSTSSSSVVMTFASAKNRRRKRPEHTCTKKHTEAVNNVDIVGRNPRHAFLQGGIAWECYRPSLLWVFGKGVDRVKAATIGASAATGSSC
jgi:hypothetical protein